MAAGRTDLHRCIKGINMRREKDDNNDEFEDEFSPYFDTDDGDEDEMDVELIEKQLALEMVQLELVQADLNIRVMNMAVDIVQKGWFWRFRSPQTKLKVIQTAYRTLMETLYPKQEEGD
jgi:hypothetical protein